jgi:hypothetical protein
MFVDNKMFNVGFLLVIAMFKCSTKLLTLLDTCDLVLDLWENQLFFGNCNFYWDIKRYIQLKQRRETERVSPMEGS